MPAAELDWSAIVLAVVGGDEREPEIVRLAAATGADVRAYGLPWPDAGIAGAILASNAYEAMEGARYALLPVPRGVGRHLYAPAAPTPIAIDRALFAPMAGRASVFCGRATDVLVRAAQAAGVALHEYDPDRELMLQRAPAIVEGILQLAIERTDVTIHAAETAVVGYGTIGSLLARKLVALGARVHVAARNPVQRAGAHADGAAPCTLDELPDLAPRLAMLFSAVPAHVVGREVLERLPRDSLVLDVAPAPDHIDFDLVARLGHRGVWARGMGRRAPLTVGRSQWHGIRSRIEQIEADRRTA